MKLQLLRNATLVIEIGADKLLVDPMLGAKGTFLPFTAVRHKPVWNPTVGLPAAAESALRGVTAALITHFRHGHVDHLDRAGRDLLAERQIPVYCPRDDAPHLRRRGIAAVALTPGGDEPFLGGHIRVVAATHGHGFIARLMGAGAGYVLRFPGEPTLYLSGDTVLTDAVAAVLRDVRPDVSVVHAGGASLDVGKPILMTLDEITEFVRLAAPGVVVATHLEALNHCPTTRADVAAAVERAGASDRVRIPADGETLTFDRP